MIRNTLFSIHFFKSQVFLEAVCSGKNSYLRLLLRLLLAKSYYFIKFSYCEVGFTYIYINFYTHTHKTIISTFTQLEIRNTKLTPADKSIWIKAEVPTDNRKTLECLNVDIF